MPPPLSNERMPSMRFGRFWLMVVAMILWSAVDGHAGESLTIRIKSDGSSEINFDQTQTRTNAERDVRMWERYQQQLDADADDANVTPAVAPAEPRPMTDEELGKKIREISAMRDEQRGGPNPGEITLLNIETNQVRVVTRRRVSKLEELVSEMAGILNLGGLMVENVRVEQTNQWLVMTLTPSAGVRSYGKRLFQSWRLAGVSREIRIEFPGKVLASGLPKNSEQASGFRFDASKSDAVEVLSKLHQSSIVITAQSGGLKLTQPLEASAMRRAVKTGTGEQLAVMDAEPGYTVEPTSVSTTIIHRFPGAPAPALSKGGIAMAMHSGRSEPGTQVRAKLFPPKGRTIRSVSGVRVIRALDDQGRAIATVAASNDTEAEMMMEMGRRNVPGGGTDISLRLQLPLPDARSIEELQGEAIVTSNGRWKEMLLTNLTETSTNEVDLGSILAGARFALVKLAQRNRQTTLQVRLTGGESIRDVEVELVVDALRGSSNVSDRGANSRGGQTTRTLQIDYYRYDPAGTSAKGPVTLRVRYPEDRRRERVQFVLKELDLL